MDLSPGTEKILNALESLEGNAPEWIASANEYVTIQNQRILTEAMYEEYDPLPRKLKIGDTIRVPRPLPFKAR